MVKILAVCGMGLGSGLMLRMTIERVLKKRGIPESKFDLEVTDINSANQPGVDVFVTTPEFAQSIKGRPNNIIVIKNIFDEEEMEKSLMPILEKLIK